jgi:SAM-dependent methyltransferase
MFDKRTSFYRNVISGWVTDKDASILVVGGGPTDRDVFFGLNFRNVTISNLDVRLHGDEFAPYRWSFQNAESLTFQDKEFDHVVTHAALHHCSSPHRALLEMYRVARRSIVLIESRDSLLVRLLEVLKLTLIYETAAVYYNSGRYGGVNNTDIPNFVYRWREREVEKTISSYAPHARHKFQWRYGTDVPHLGMTEKKGRLKVLAVALGVPFHWLLTRLFRKQQNLFACRVGKPQLPQDLYAWIALENGRLTFNKGWAQKTYKPIVAKE